MSSGTEDIEYYRQEYNRGTDPWTGMEWLDRRTNECLDLFRNEIPEPKTALDMGCGRGRITQQLTARGFATVGLDFLQLAFPEHRNEGSTFVRGNVMELPFAPNTFSLLVDYGYLHHVRKQEWKRYRRTIKQALKPAGFLFVNVFHERDGHANNEERPWVYHRGHYDRFFSREMLDRCLGTSFIRREATVVEENGPHVFLHACYQMGKGEGV